jgi:hypothetical protein
MQLSDQIEKVGIVTTRLVRTVKQGIQKFVCLFIDKGSVADVFFMASEVIHFCSCLGNDEISKIMEEKTRAAGVNVRYQRTDKYPTGR